MNTFKKAVCFAVAICFAFAPVVSAADVCQTCKSPINELIYTNEQGNCSAISYENANGAGPRLGYNARSQAVGLWPKVVLDLCACPNANTNFKVNKIIGMRLTILTPGVYWTDDPVAVEPFFPNQACLASYNPGVNVYYDDGVAGSPFDNPAYKTGEEIPNPANNRTGTVHIPRTTIIDGARVPSPGYVNQGPQGTPGARDGVMTYLDTLPEYHLNSNLAALGFWVDDTLGGKRSTANTRYNYYLSDYSTKVTGDNLIKVGSAVSCSIPAAKRAQIIEISRAWQIGMLEDQYNLCNWWIDIPQMRKDNSVVEPMSELKVKIELLSDDTGGLCSETAAICECTVTLGVFGADKFTMYFPYVLTQSDPWTTGIAVTNLGTSFTKLENMNAIFTLTDSKGKEFTYTKNNFDSVVWTTMLDALLSNFQGGTPAAGPAWLKVEANFPVDGYEFITDGVFGAGTQPRVYDNLRIRSSKVY